MRFRAGDSPVDVVVDIDRLTDTPTPGNRVDFALQPDWTKRMEMASDAQRDPHSFTAAIG
jgi:hypothetical protein